MRKLVVTLNMILLFSIVVHAQNSKTKLNGKTTFGAKAGVGIQNFYGKDEIGKYDFTMRLKWNAGLNAEIPIGTKFFFQPGLTIATKGSRFNNTQSANGILQLKWNLYYLDIPLSLLYKLEAANGTSGFLFGLGPYIGFGIGGKIIIDNDMGEHDEVDVEYQSEVPADSNDGLTKIKRMDGGLNVFAGYDLNKKIQIMVYSQIGLTNIVPKEAGRSDQIKNIGFGINVGYRLVD